MNLTDGGSTNPSAPDPSSAAGAADLADHLSEIVNVVADEWEEALFSNPKGITREYFQNAWVALARSIQSWANDFDNVTPDQERRWIHPVPIEDLVSWPIDARTDFGEILRLQEATLFIVESLDGAFRRLVGPQADDRLHKRDPLGDFWTSGGFAIVGGLLDCLARLMRHQEALAELRPPVTDDADRLGAEGLTTARLLINLGQHEASIPFLLRSAYSAVSSKTGLPAGSLKRPLHGPLAKVFVDSPLPDIVRVLERTIKVVATGNRVSPSLAIALSIQALDVIGSFREATEPALSSTTIRKLLSK